MSLQDLLGRYANVAGSPPPHVFDDFDQVAHELPPEDLGDGIEDAFNSDDTPPFERMVSQLYDQSDPNTRAGLLNEILGSLGGSSAGTALGGGLAGGVLADMVRRMDRNNQISPDDTRYVPAKEIENAAAEAARRNPSIVQRVSRFYARHPQLVRTLGQAALAIAMRGMARRRRI